MGQASVSASIAETLGCLAIKEVDGWDDGLTDGINDRNGFEWEKRFEGNNKHNLFTQVGRNMSSYY